MNGNGPYSDDEVLYALNSYFWRHPDSKVRFVVDNQGRTVDMRYLIFANDQLQARIWWRKGRGWTLHLRDGYPEEVGELLQHADRKTGGRLAEIYVDKPLSKQVIQWYETPYWIAQLSG